ncbi:MAG: T9SS type A sorting domain-containing protein [Saprospiraceae bacterium]|uniref:T9SS type A sorting domain-containing protein n=1 Tax=Candidatus Defluviibacterium haderslevense TaxID=2981993 RepID=A0A9D7SAH3_9BACT|nr:T9SS type A sorting domain-containing protein [Candidatus Defluviibacterium haderslevense]
MANKKLRISFLYSFLLIFINQLLFSQEIKVVIVDSSGQRDSVVFGFNPNSKIGEDPNLGEFNLYGTPMKPFEIRIIQRDSSSYFNCDSNYIPRREIYANNFDSKINIKPFDLNNIHSRTFEIIINCSKLTKMSFSSELIDLGLGTDYELYHDTCSAGAIMGITQSIKEFDLITFVPRLMNLQKIKLISQNINTATKLEKTSNNYKVYPNPAKTYFWVDNPELDILQIEVFDLFGRRVLKQKTNHNEAKVKVLISDLVNGSYLVKIKSDKKTMTKQLILEN